MVAVALIPCRLSSERIPRKNLREIAPGLTLVQQAVDCAVQSRCFGRVIVTTDDPCFACPGAEVIRQPPEISGPMADISRVAQWLLMRHATDADWIATLQPAVLARSPQIVRDLTNYCMCSDMSGVTMAASHPWAWTETSGGLCAWWRKDGEYPRSQHMPRTLVEINACQVTTAANALAGLRWTQPLAVLELPYWAQALDIDTPDQLAGAIDLWPWAESRLAAWRGPIFPYRKVQ